MKVALLLYGQLRTFDSIWPYNEQAMSIFPEYDVFIVSAVKNVHRANDYRYIGEEQVRFTFEKHLTTKIKQMIILSDPSLKEKGAWDEYNRKYKVYRQYGDGVNAYDPEDYGYDTSLKLTDEEYQKRTELVNSLRVNGIIGKEGTVINTLDHQYLFHEPISGSELQCPKRELLFKVAKPHLHQYDAIIVTRPDFRFDFDVLLKIKEIGKFESNELYTYPSDFYPMSDLFMVGNEKSVEVLCNMNQWYRYYEYYELEQLYDLLMKPFPFNEVGYNWGSPVGLENLTSYHLIRNGIDIKYLSSNPVARNTNLVR